jgi:ABC-2 type transport system ATP-binding protein
MYVKEYLGFVASLYKPETPVSKQVERIIETTGLAPEQKKKIGSLSKGYRQRVGLAQALIHNPGVLILDEPTTGLDPNQIVEIRNLIMEAGKKKTVLLSTHIMQEVEAICDRIIIIDKGVIVADEEKGNIYSIISRTGQTIEVEFDRELDDLLVEKLGTIGSVKKGNDKTLIIESEGDQDIRPALFSFAVNNNLTVLSLRRKESNLEEIFRLLTNG